jgi:hypothetical protein
MVLSHRGTSPFYRFHNQQFDDYALISSDQLHEVCCPHTSDDVLPVFIVGYQVEKI